MPRSFGSPREQIAWTYAQLACAHSALKAGRIRYVTLDYMIRAKLFAGLRDQRMEIGSVFDDEKLKLAEPIECAYCRSTEQLTVDHLIPRRWGGVDAGTNLLRACTLCNSSKRDRDLLIWYSERGGFPRLMVLRRYLKIVAMLTEAAGLLDCATSDERLGALPFPMDRLPTSLPPLTQLEI